MKKIFLIFSLAAAQTFAVYSQESGLFTQSGINNLFYNPAFSGMEDVTEFRLMGRQNWINMPSAPRYLGASVSGYIQSPRANYHPNGIPVSDADMMPDKTAGKKSSKVVRHGLSFTCEMEQIGAFTTVSGNLSYSVHFPVVNSFKIAMGPVIGVSGRNFDANSLFVFDNPDPTLNQSANYFGFIMNVGFGTVFYNKNFYAGYSIRNLTGNRVHFRDTPTNNSFTLTHYLNAGYVFDLPKGFQLMPGVVVRYADPLPPIVDISLKMRYKNYFWVGGGYRYNQAAFAMAGFSMTRFVNIGYAFDYSLNRMGSNSFGSHEVVLTITPGMKPGQKLKFSW